MRFRHPSGYEFEIADGWLTEAGFAASATVSRHYRAPSNVAFEAVPLADIEPIRRQVELDGNGFCRRRLVQILKGLAADAELPPIQVHPLPCGPFKYGLRDGFHRFYASLAAGYLSIPAIILPYFVFET